MPIMTGIFRTPIYALAVDRATSPCRIALAAGPEIHLATPINNGGKCFRLGVIHGIQGLHKEYFATVAILPKPTDLPAVPMKRGDVRIRGRSLHFTNNGRNLLVSYLNHGIVFIYICCPTTTSDLLSLSAVGISPPWCGCGKLFPTTPILICEQCRTY